MKKIMKSFAELSKIATDAMETTIEYIRLAIYFIDNDEILPIVQYARKKRY